MNGLVTVPTLSLFPRRANNSQCRALGPPKIRAASLAKSVHGQMGREFYFPAALLPGEQVDLQFSGAWVLQTQHEAEVLAKKQNFEMPPTPPHTQRMQENLEQQPELIFLWNIRRYLWVGSIRHWGPLPTGFVSQGNESGVEFMGFWTSGQTRVCTFQILSDEEQLPSCLHRQLHIQMGSLLLPSPGISARQQFLHFTFAPCFLIPFFPLPI